MIVIEKVSFRVVPGNIAEMTVSDAAQPPIKAGTHPLDVNTGGCTVRQLKAQLSTMQLKVSRSSV